MSLFDEGEYQASSSDSAWSSDHSAEKRARSFEKRCRVFVSDIRSSELLSPRWLRMAQSVRRMAGLIQTMANKDRTANSAAGATVASSSSPSSQLGPAKMAVLRQAFEIDSQSNNQRWKKTTPMMMNLNTMNHIVKKEQSEGAEYGRIAVRLVIEEGKLNLLLRTLTALKQASMFERPRLERLKAECATEHKVRADAVEKVVKSAESSLGKLLELSLREPEAVQILDVNHCLDHCECLLSRVVSQAFNHFREPLAPFHFPFPGCQESLVLLYCLSLARALVDDCSSDLTLSKLTNLVPTALCFLAISHPQLPTHTVCQGMCFLSEMFGADTVELEARDCVGHSQFPLTEGILNQLNSLHSTLIQNKSLQRNQTVHLSFFLSQCQQLLRVGE